MSGFEEFLAEQTQRAQPLPADAALAPPPAALEPAQVPDDFAKFLAQAKGEQESLTTQSAQAVAVANSQQSAATAGQAAPIARALGVPQAAIETDVPSYQAQALAQKNAGIVAANPVLARWVAANPDSARVAQDEFDKLGVMEQGWTALKTGAGTALLTNQMGRLGNTKQLAAAAGQAAPQTDQEIAALQSRIAAQPQLRGGAGVAERVAGFVAGILDNFVTGGSQGALAGAAVGGGMGAVAGGVGALPGAATGALVGAGAGFNVDMARVAAGNAYIKMDAMRGSDGQPLGEGAKQFGALFTGVATYAIGSYATAVESKIFQRNAEAIAQAAIAKAVTMPTFARASATFAGEAAKVLRAVQPS